MPLIWGQNSNNLLQIPESDSIESDIYNAQQQKDIVERNNFGNAQYRQHTHTTLLLCKGQELTLSPTHWQADIIGDNPILFPLFFGKVA
jgi:hypothetical protein